VGSRASLDEVAMRKISLPVLGMEPRSSISQSTYYTACALTSLNVECTLKHKAAGDNKYEEQTLSNIAAFICLV